MHHDRKTVERIRQRAYAYLPATDKTLDADRAVRLVEAGLMVPTHPGGYWLRARCDEGV